MEAPAAASREGRLLSYIMRLAAHLPASQALQSCLELSAFIYTQRAVYFTINVGAFGGLISSPHHPISVSPHLGF